ncbi:MAG: hypothetical protein Kow0092_06300 [Deferrisomatales bacterium]
MKPQAMGWLAISLLLWSCAALPPQEDAVVIERPALPENGKVEVGKLYFDFAAPDLDGQTVRLSDLVGPRVVLVQVWGIRCAPCLTEIAFLSTLQRKYAGRGLQVVSVNTDRVDGPRLAQALEARGLAPPYPILLDEDFAVTKHYTQWLIPVTVLIDRQGVVRSLHTGYRPELDAVIEAEVEALLGGVR